LAFLVLDMRDEDLMVAFCLSNWKKVTNLLKMVAIRVKADAFVLKTHVGSVF
jgi:hypothetical protein